MTIAEILNFLARDSILVKKEYINKANTQMMGDMRKPNSFEMIKNMLKSSNYML